MVDLAISSHPAHSLAQPWYPAYQEREKRRAAEKERKRQEAKVVGEKWGRSQLDNPSAYMSGYI